MSFNIIEFTKAHPYEIAGGVFGVGLVIILLLKRHNSAPALSEAGQIKLAQIQAGAANVAARENAAPGLAAARASSAEAQAQARAEIQTAAIAGRTGIAEGRQGVQMNAANDQAAIRDAVVNATTEREGNQLAYQSAIYGDKTGFEIAQMNAKSAQQEYLDALALQGADAGHYYDSHGILYQANHLYGT